MLDTRLGSHAPFLISLSNRLREELHIMIATAEVGNLGENIPDFEGVEKAVEEKLHEILAHSRPIEINETCLRYVFAIIFLRLYNLLNLLNKK